MREKIRNKERLEHIISAIDIILDKERLYGLKTLETDPFIFFAFVKQIEIIGEAVYKLTPAFRQQHPEIEWDVIEGMRHVLVHGYYAISPQMLWATIQNDLRPLRARILTLIGKNNC